MINILLGLVFLALGAANTFLMYRLWGYPSDHERHVSSAPPRLMLIHRLTGYLYLAIYIYLMVEMVPRLWTVQIELPARSVMHLLPGMSIGVLVTIKVAIVRFFKHLESQLVPILGTALLVCTVLLLGLSVPTGLREVQLSRRAGLSGGLDAAASARVLRLIDQAGMPASAPTAELASTTSLADGRSVLLNRCVACHDLRTVLVRPRTPSDWWRTVARMGERSLLLEPITLEEQQRVTAYLIAISPALQVCASQTRAEDQEAERRQAQAAATSAVPDGER